MQTAYLVDDEPDIDWQFLEGKSRISITAGASTPGEIVQRVVEADTARMGGTITYYNARRPDTFLRPSRYRPADERRGLG